MRRCLAIMTLLGMAIGHSPSEAQEPAPPPEAPILHEVSPGIFEIGQMTLDRKARSIRFPGEVNMKEGIIEYLLVTDRGSTHESLLVSYIQPKDLHFAMLLLGAKGSGEEKAAPGEVPSGPIDAKYLKTAPKLKGEAVAITVQWKENDETKSLPVEDWIFNTETKKPMERGSWTYNGSLFNDGHFLAQVEGAFASLVTYPSALINNPRQGNNNDAIWTVNEKAVPPAKTPLEICIQILPANAPQAKPSP